MDLQLSEDSARSIELGAAFRQNLLDREPVAFRHTLPADPALDLQAVADLADALPTGSAVCEGAQRPLVFADGAREPQQVLRPGNIIRTLDESGAWLTLLNIEKQPHYRAFIDDQLDRLARQCGMDPAQLFRRMGFVFASSPGSVTGAHFDVEHSLLLQLRGNRVLSFGEFPDADTRDREIRRYWNGSYGKLTTMPADPRDVPIGPGDGVYIPPFRPHWIRNGDASSFSLTITFFTDQNESETLVQAFNERLRKFGVTPRRQGESPRRDRMKAAVMRGQAALRRRSPA
jgi:hypothetical protein